MKNSIKVILAVLSLSALFVFSTGCEDETGIPNGQLVLKVLDYKGGNAYMPVVKLYKTENDMQLDTNFIGFHNMGQGGIAIFNDLEDGKYFIRATRNPNSGNFTASFTGESEPVSKGKRTMQTIQLVQ